MERRPPTFPLALPEETRHRIDRLRVSRPFLKSTTAAILFVIHAGLRELDDTHTAADARVDAQDRPQ